MIVSNSKKFIFIHIPKTAGTSITVLLDREVEWNDIVLGGTVFGEAFAKNWSPRFELYKHSLPMQIKKVLGDSAYIEFRKFVVVRDPLLRVVSAYNYLRTLILANASWFIESDEYKKIGDIETFDKFVEGRYFLDSFDVDPLRTHDIQRCFLPQSLYFDRDEFLNGRFDFFRLEDLQKSVYPLIENSYLISLNDFPHENKSKKFTDQISLRKIEFLKTLYKEDYENFGY